ncbi:MAG: putative ABC transporter permease, partial [Oscillospiraceae bacterium]
GIMAAIISFLGFLLENIWLAFTKGYIDNRNMTMPFLFGYGMAVISIYAIFGTPQNMLLAGRIPVKEHSELIYFIAVFFAVSIGEIVLGYAVEKLCGFEYWNYTRLPLHVTKYTSVFTSLGFAAIISLFMHYAFCPIMELIGRINPEIGKTAAFLLTAIMFTDFVVSFYRMHKKHSLNERWRISISDDDHHIVKTTI